MQKKDFKIDFINGINNCLLFNEISYLSDCVYDKLWSYFLLISNVNNLKNLVSKNMTFDDILDLFCDAIIGSFYLRSSLDVVDIYDVGSGAGFPGIVTSLICENNKIFLIDSSRRKCSFLRQLRAHLKINNIEIINDRVENISPKEFIITKAALSPKNIHMLKNIIGKKTRVVFFMGQNQEEEIISAMNALGNFFITKTYYSVPSLKKRGLLSFVSRETFEKNL
jgi:16S rRNA (guanine527-N7)-methyltransferase